MNEVQKTIVTLIIGGSCIDRLAIDHLPDLYRWMELDNVEKSIRDESRVLNWFLPNPRTAEWCMFGW